MNALLNYVREVIGGTWSLATGMGVTMRYMFKPVTTVQYPRQRLPLPAAFRGPIELVRLEGGDHRCVACGECFRTCPSGVIKVQGHKSVAASRNQGRFYFIDFARCSLCGLCVEVCPEGALRFSRDYEQCGLSSLVGVQDLMAKLKEEHP
ncbi:MAG: NADH-quinone oxidoreductase subunit I [Desulfarculus sp.]|nr:NADH-quinone oxidoreductase subunit I [Desulfarculus sp.]